jgi:uncharacterized protein
MPPELNLSRRDADALREFTQKVRETFGQRITSLKLFGSKASGRDSPESDIDVCVILERASLQDEDHILDLAFETNLRHDMYISPRVLDQALLDDRVWKVTPFLQAIQKEGLPL